MSSFWVFGLWQHLFCRALELDLESTLRSVFPIRPTVRGTTMFFMSYWLGCLRSRKRSCTCKRQSLTFTWIRWVVWGCSAAREWNGWGIISVWVARLFLRHLLTLLVSSCVLCRTMLNSALFLLSPDLRRNILVSYLLFFSLFMSVLFPKKAF